MLSLSKILPTAIVAFKGKSRDDKQGITKPHDSIMFCSSLLCCPDQLLSSLFFIVSESNLHITQPDFGMRFNRKTQVIG